MMNLARVVVAFAALSLFGGCAQQKEHANPTGMVNSVCVISGEALDAGCPTVDYMGNKVGFCCDKCVAKWNKMDDAAHKAAMAKITK
jgi:hypothetical protein